MSAQPPVQPWPAACLPGNVAITGLPNTDYFKPLNLGVVFYSDRQWYIPVHTFIIGSQAINAIPSDRQERRHSPLLCSRDRTPEPKLLDITRCGARGRRVRDPCMEGMEEPPGF